MNLRHKYAVNSAIKHHFTVKEHINGEKIK